MSARKQPVWCTCTDKEGLTVGYCGCCVGWQLFTPKVCCALLGVCRDYRKNANLGDFFGCKYWRSTTGVVLDARTLGWAASPMIKCIYGTQIRSMQRPQ
jgi:hypothetical protein